MKMQGEGAVSSSPLMEMLQRLFDRSLSAQILWGGMCGDPDVVLPPDNSKPETNNRNGSKTTGTTHPETSASDDMASHDIGNQNSKDESPPNNFTTLVMDILYQQCQQSPCSPSTAPSKPISQQQAQRKIDIHEFDTADIDGAIQKGMLRAEKTNLLADGEEDSFSIRKPELNQTFHRNNPHDVKIATRHDWLAPPEQPTKPLPPVAVDNDEGGVDTSTFPFTELTIVEASSAELQLSVSELTMHSHGDAYLNFLPNIPSSVAHSANRRMAYYAIGKHLPNDDKQPSSHRRCYFTGWLIRPGEPFYAGSVQQGLRTLVVFCLPRSIGLPLCDRNSEEPHSTQKAGSKWGRTSRLNATSKYCRAQSNFSSGASVDGCSTPSERACHGSALVEIDNGNALDKVGSISDEARERLLKKLPEPNEQLLDEMKRRYPDQFSTLPLQVRLPPCWRLFVKFCFFSGLPIAEGEMHYRIKHEVQRMSGVEETINLSHEVMEAINGEQSAEILRLPNKKTFVYLRRNYSQQSAKLEDIVFHRESWEVVLPEC